jgi:hypothetical protein
MPLAWIVKTDNVISVEDDYAVVMTELPRPGKKTDRWGVSYIDFDFVFVSNTLVGNKFDKDRPLARLCSRSNDVAARLFLIMLCYLHIDNGVVFSSLITRCYEPKVLKDGVFYTIYSAKLDKKYLWFENMSKFLGVSDKNSCKTQNDALEYLISIGLITRCVVLNLYKEDNELHSYHILDTKDEYSICADDRLCVKMKEAARRLCGYSGRTDGRFYDEYAVVVPKDLDAEVLECYMLRYAENNMKILKHSEAMKSREEYDDYINNWMKRLAVTKDGNMH